MELLLNTIWLLIAVGAFLFWRLQTYAGTRHRGHGRPLAILALVCALVLLFPVISLTDDLHAEQVTMEDSSRPLMKIRNMVNGCLRASSSSLIAGVPDAPRSAAVLHLIAGALVPLDTPVLCLTLISAHEGRSPPPYA